MSRPLDSELRRTARRIGIQTAVLLMVSLVVVSAVVYATVLRSQQLLVDEALDQAMTLARQNGDLDSDHDRDSRQPDARIRVAVLTADGLRSSGDLPAGLPLRSVMDQVRTSGAVDRRTVRVPSGQYALLTQRHGDRVTQVMYSLFVQHQERERILSALGWASLVGVLLSTLLGAWLARRAVRPMAEALILQRRFVADAGHELRTPLTLLSTRAQLLRRRLLAPRAAGRDISGTQLDQQIIGDVDGIVDDTRTLAEILEELLIAADTRTPVPVEQLDLTALVSEAVAAAQAWADQRSVTLTFASQEQQARVAGTAAALTRAVTALIDNAVTHATSRVDVVLERSRREFSIQVSDDGPGIDRDALPRMFERFAGERSGQNEADGHRHYGLGLALVSEIASRHRGTVRATNRASPSHGAILTLTLPADPTAQAARSRPSRRPQTTPEAPSRAPTE